MEGSVVAVRAAFDSDRTVPVEACEVGVDDQFLEPFTIEATVPAGRSVVSFAFGKIEHSLAKLTIYGYFYEPKKVTMNIRITALAALAAAILPLAVSTQQYDGVKEIKILNKELLAPRTKAVVELSANFMREEPDYITELGDQALIGTVVEIIEKHLTE